MALGASGAQIGTAFLLCPEAQTKPVHRAALKSEASRVTALTNLFSGGAARGIVNRVIRELGPMNNTAPVFPLASAAITVAREGRSRRQWRFLTLVVGAECHRL